MTIDPETLLRAYSVGLFPMADSREASDVFWVEPRDRAILPLDGFHMSRSLRKTLRRDSFTITCNRAFANILSLCAETAPDREDSWINREIRESYQLLHRLGHAHSIECWQDDALVGGLYGVSLGRVFCGESMFSRADNASKVALAALVAAMRLGGFKLLDCQFMTDHLASLGAVEISQEDYVLMLAKVLADSNFAKPQSRPRLSNMAATSLFTKDETDSAQAYPSTSSSKSSMVGSGKVGAGDGAASGAGAGAGAGTGATGRAGLSGAEPSLPDALGRLVDPDAPLPLRESPVDAARAGLSVASESATTSSIMSSSPGKRIAQFLIQTS
jgi:leucyl/phenylalanyl-tRNA--protein transferase